MTEIERWRGRVALVTGATSGIGRATTRALLEAGLRVAAAGRRNDRLEEIARDGRAGLDRFLPLPLDLRDERQILEAFETVRGKWGGVDVLVNAAGLGRFAPLLSGQTAAWREMLDVNVLALCVCTREAVRDMLARGEEGHVINISSMSAYRVPEESGIYAATKFAVRALTEGLRRELRERTPRVRVTAISPGFVETEFALGYWGDRDRAERTYSRYRVLDADDVARMVLFALAQPSHAQIHDILVRPTEQPD